MDRVSEGRLAKMEDQNPTNEIKRKKIWTKKRIIIWVIVVLFLVALVIDVLCMGIFVEHMGGFDFRSVTILEDVLKEDQHVSFYIKDDIGIGIPFVLWFTLLRSPPYSMSLTIYDSTNSLDEIVLESANIHYEDGEKRNIELNWHKKLDSARVLSEITSEGEVYEPYRRLIDEKTPAFIERCKSCTVILEGYFIDAEGKRLVFKTNNHFEYEPPYWKIGGCPAF